MKGARRRTVVFYGGARAVGDRSRGGLATNLVLRHAREQFFFFLRVVILTKCCSLRSDIHPFIHLLPPPFRPHFHTLGFLSTFSLFVTITF